MTPLNGHVLCQVPAHAERRPDSLIIRPESSNGRPDRATVLAVSKGHYTPKGALVPPTVCVGEVVLFNPYRISRVIGGRLGEGEGTPCACPGDTFLIHQNEVFAVVG